VRVGGAATVRGAWGVLPAAGVVSLAVTLLLFTPAVVPWTSADTVHEVPGARLAPVSDTDDDPPVAVAVQPQVLFRLGVEATTNPAGRVSVNETPLSV